VFGTTCLPSLSSMCFSSQWLALQGCPIGCLSPSSVAALCVGLFLLRFGSPSTPAACFSTASVTVFLPGVQLLLSCVGCYVLPSGSWSRFFSPAPECAGKGQLPRSVFIRRSDFASIPQLVRARRRVMSVTISGRLPSFLILLLPFWSLWKAATGAGISRSQAKSRQ
jgi:hypothetical protein